MANDVKDKIFGEMPSIKDILSCHDGDRLIKLYDKINKCQLRLKYILSDFEQSMIDVFVVLYEDGLYDCPILKSLESRPDMPYMSLSRVYKEYSLLRTFVNQYQAQIDAILGGYR